jgi:D-3-phosphoglycerate dehydrogenase / 2-oxoglutarate reductase
MGRVLVTPRSVTRDGHPALAALEAAGHEIVFTTPGCFPSEDELLEKLPDCCAYLAGVEPITARVLGAASALKVISRNGTGVDSIDMATAERLGIKVCRAAGANARGVAELTFGLILALLRAIPLSDRALKHETWERHKGLELEGRSLGLIGCGKIGRYVAQFAQGFDMKVLAYDPEPCAELGAMSSFAYVTLGELLEQAHIISLHCPALLDQRPLVGTEAVNQMRPGVYLVNTARGSLIDIEAILAGLNSGHISGVAVDAFAQEPPEDWRLVGHAHVIGTAHIGGFTAESIDRAVSVAVENLLQALR